MWQLNSQNNKISAVNPLRHNLISSLFVIKIRVTDYIEFFYDHSRKFLNHSSLNFTEKKCPRRSQNNSIALHKTFISL